MNLYVCKCVMATPTFSRANDVYTLSAGAVVCQCGRHVISPLASLAIRMIFPSLSVRGDFYYLLTIVVCSVPHTHLTMRPVSQWCPPFPPAPHFFFQSPHQFCGYLAIIAYQSCTLLCVCCIVYVLHLN